MTRRPTPYILAFLAIYTAVAIISPDMLGAPYAVRVFVNFMATIAIIAGFIFLIKDLTK